MTKIKGQYWINKKSKLVWCCDEIENEIIIYRNNQTKVISKKSLLKNFTKQI